MTGDADRRRYWSWANLPLRVKGLVLVPIPLLPLLVATIAFYRVHRQNQNTENWVTHTVEVRVEIQHLLMLLVDTETGVRGYAPTRRDTIVGPYQQSKQAIPLTAAHLAHLVQDSPVQLQRLRPVQLQIDQLLRLLTALRRYQTAPSSSAAKPPEGLLRQSEAAMDVLRGELAAMQADETRLWVERRAAGRAYGMLILLLGLAGGFFAMLRFTAGVVRRVQGLEENAHRLAQGLPLTLVASSGDEIGRLGSALQTASALLTNREEALRDQTRILDSVLYSLGEGVVVADQDGNFLVFNPAAERILGIGAVDASPDEWTQRYDCRLPDQVTPYPPADLPLARAIRGEAVDEAELFIRPPEQPEGVWLSVNARPVKEPTGVLRGGVAIFRDVTERKHAEEQIQQLHANLEKRAIQVEATNKELEAFSYSVSHDLRAPLRSIDGFSQALLEDCSDQLEETGKSYLQRIRAASQRMGQLIDDLLLLSRLTRSELRPEIVDLTALARGITDELHQREPQREVEFVVEDGLVAEGDARLLQVALENLLGNALKYTGKQERSRIEFGATGNGGGPVYFVRDNGIGFNMAYADKLFGAFQRLHGMNEFPGTGIGLATVQRIIHRHGGRAWAEGAVDNGATFYFTLGQGEQHDEGHHLAGRG